MDWSLHFPHYVVEEEQSKEVAEGETTAENGSAMEGVTTTEEPPMPGMPDPFQVLEIGGPQMSY